MCLHFPSVLSTKSLAFFVFLMFFQYIMFYKIAYVNIHFSLLELLDYFNTIMVYNGVYYIIYFYLINPSK